MMTCAKKGFTIVEMMMVIGILAVLTGIVTTASSAAIRTARQRRTEAVKHVIQAGISTYQSQKDYWPPKSGQLNTWADSGISSDSANGVRGGRKVAFLSATQYDEVMYELVKESVGKTGASPMIDPTGIIVARKSAADAKAGRGIEFSEAIKKNKKHGSSISLKDMVFGYQDKETGYFRRYIVQYNSDSDSIIVMTRSDYNNWYINILKDTVKWPTGYQQK